MDVLKSNKLAIRVWYALLCSWLFYNGKAIFKLNPSLG